MIATPLFLYVDYLVHKWTDLFASVKWRQNSPCEHKYACRNPTKGTESFWIHTFDVLKYPGLSEDIDWCESCELHVRQVSFYIFFLFFFNFFSLDCQSFLWVISHFFKSTQHHFACTVFHRATRHSLNFSHSMGLCLISAGHNCPTVNNGRPGTMWMHPGRPSTHSAHILEYECAPTCAAEKSGGQECWNLVAFPFLTRL